MKNGLGASLREERYARTAVTGQTGLPVFPTKTSTRVPNWSRLMAVFDGHSGKEAAKFTREQLWGVLWSLSIGSVDDDSLFISRSC